MPRSGSTVLASILAQNPHIVTTATSDLIGHGCRAGTEAQRRHGEVQGLVIDKNRAWASPYGVMITTIVSQGLPKILYPTRSVDEILASYRRVVDASPIMPTLVLEQLQRGFPSLEDSLMSPFGNVGAAIFAREELRALGQDRHLYEFDYADLVDHPEDTLAGIYDFLGIAPFDHDFGNISNPSPENDLALYGLPGLHDIRPVLARAA